MRKTIELDKRQKDMQNGKRAKDKIQNRHADIRTKRLKCKKTKY